MSHGQGPPRSSTADAMRLIIAHYAAVADPTLFFVGERYLNQEGAPGRIILVRGNGKGGPPLRVGDGNCGSFAQQFTAYLWGAETADDLDRYDAVEAMVDRYQNAIRKVIPGRCELATINPAVNTNVLTFGEELQVVATYTRSVPRDAAIWGVAVTPVSPPDPMRPNGGTGYEFELEVSTTGSR